MHTPKTENSLREQHLESDPDAIAEAVEKLNTEIAKGAARHVAENITQNQWFHGRPDRIQELVERVILVAHYRMSGNT